MTTSGPLFLQELVRKTRVLTFRIAHMIADEEFVLASLAITFTNKAG